MIQSNKTGSRGYVMRCYHCLHRSFAHWWNRRIRSIQKAAPLLLHPLPYPAVNRCRCGISGLFPILVALGWPRRRVCPWRWHVSLWHWRYLRMLQRESWDNVSPSRAKWRSEQCSKQSEYLPRGLSQGDSHCLRSRF